MRKVFLLVMVCLLLVLSISCKSKNERILEKVKKNVPSEMVYKRNLIKKYCMDISFAMEKGTENSEKCLKKVSDIETEYNEKFLALLEYYNDEQANINEKQELYNEIENKKLYEEGVEIVSLDENDFTNLNFEDIRTYKLISMKSLFIIDSLGELGIYASEIEEIKNSNDFEWQKSRAMEFHLRVLIITGKEKIPEFSDMKIQEYVERYFEFIETCKIYIMYKEKEKLTEYEMKNSKKIHDDLKSLIGVSDEDSEKIIKYMEEKVKELHELVEEQKTENKMGNSQKDK